VTPLADEPAQRADRGGALSFPVVMSIFGVLLALGLTLAVVIHRRYVGFVRVAAHHVPPDTTLVVRWDVEKVSLFEPTRRFLLPLLDSVHGPPYVPAPNATPAPNGGLDAPVANGSSAPNPASAPKGASMAESRRDRFARESGSMISRDLREGVALFGPGEHDWAVVLAGSFPKSDLVTAASRTFEEEGWSWRAVGADRLVSPGGAALGRASDGALVLASSGARLDAVLVDRPPLPEVPREGAGALRALPIAQGLPPGAEQLFDTLGHPLEVDAEAEWGSPLPVHLTLHFPGQPPSDAKDRVRRALGLVLNGDLERIEHVTAPVRVQSAGNQELVVTILLDDDALNQLASRVALSIDHAAGSRP
jgi:hypothetical protein